jgi:hypothetical protein
MSMNMVPAMKRPWRSQRPSLKRMPSPRPEAGAASLCAVASCASPSDKLKMPVSMPAIRPPPALAATQATISALSQ